MMTKAELDYYTRVPSLLASLVKELEKQNERLEAIEKKLDELKSKQ